MGHEHSVVAMTVLIGVHTGQYAGVKWVVDQLAML